MATLPKEGYWTYTSFARDFGIPISEVRDFLAQPENEQIRSYVLSPPQVLEMLKSERAKTPGRFLEGDADHRMSYGERQGMDVHNPTIKQDVASDFIDVAGAIPRLGAMIPMAGEALKSAFVDPAMAITNQAMAGARDIGNGNFLEGQAKVVGAPLAGLKEVVQPSFDYFGRVKDTYADAPEFLNNSPAGFFVPDEIQKAIYAGASAASPLLEPFNDWDEAVQETYVSPFKASVGLNPDRRNTAAEIVSDVALGPVSVEELPGLVAKGIKGSRVAKFWDSMDIPTRLDFRGKIEHAMRLEDPLRRNMVLGDILDTAEKHGERFSSDADFMEWVNERYREMDPQAGALRVDWTLRDPENPSKQNYPFQQRPIAGRPAPEPTPDTPKFDNALQPEPEPRQYYPPVQGPAAKDSGTRRSYPKELVRSEPAYAPEARGNADYAWRREGIIPQSAPGIPEITPELMAEIDKLPPAAREQALKMLETGSQRPSQMGGILSDPKQRREAAFQYKNAPGSEHTKSRPDVPDGTLDSYMRPTAPPKNPREQIARRQLATETRDQIEGEIGKQQMYDDLTLEEIAHVQDQLSLIDDAIRDLRRSNGAEDKAQLRRYFETKTLLREELARLKEKTRPEWQDLADELKGEPDSIAKQMDDDAFGSDTQGRGDEMMDDESGRYEDGDPPLIPNVRSNPSFEGLSFHDATTQRMTEQAAYAKARGMSASDRGPFQVEPVRDEAGKIVKKKSGSILYDYKRNRDAKRMGADPLTGDEVGFIGNDLVWSGNSTRQKLREKNPKQLDNYGNFLESNLRTVRTEAEEKIYNELRKKAELAKTPPMEPLHPADYERTLAAREGKGEVRSVRGPAGEEVAPRRYAPLTEDEEKLLYELEGKRPLWKADDLRREADTAAKMAQERRVAFSRNKHQGVVRDAYQKFGNDPAKMSTAFDGAMNAYTVAKRVDDPIDAEATARRVQSIGSRHMAILKQQYLKAKSAGDAAMMDRITERATKVREIMDQAADDAFRPIESRGGGSLAPPVDPGIDTFMPSHFDPKREGARLEAMREEKYAKKPLSEVIPNDATANAESVVSARSRKGMSILEDIQKLPPEKQAPAIARWQKRYPELAAEMDAMAAGRRGLDADEMEIERLSAEEEPFDDGMALDSFNSAPSPEAGAAQKTAPRGREGERGFIAGNLLVPEGAVKLGKRVVHGTRDLGPSLVRLYKETKDAKDWQELWRFLKDGDVELPIDRLREKLRGVPPGSPMAIKIKDAIAEVQAAVAGPNEFLDSIKANRRAGRGEIGKTRRSYEFSYKPQRDVVRDAGGAGEEFFERNYNRRRDSDLAFQEIDEDLRDLENWAPERQELLRDIREGRAPIDKLDRTERDLYDRIAGHLDRVGKEGEGKLEQRIPAFKENVHSLVTRLPKYPQELVMKGIAGKLTPQEMAKIRAENPLVESILDAIFDTTTNKGNLDVGLWFSNAKKFPDDPRYIIETDERWVPARYHKQFFPHEVDEKTVTGMVDHRRQGGAVGGQIRLGEQRGGDLPVNILRRYFKKRTEDLAQHKHFGLTGSPQSWDKQFAKFADAAEKSNTKADAAVIEMVMKREFNETYQPGETRRSFHQGLGALETALKLPKAALQNFAAMWTRMNEFGVGKTFRAFVAPKALREEARKYVHTFHRQNQQFFLDGIDPKASLINEAVNKPAEFTMRVTGFRAVEEFNAKQSAIAGMLWADEALRNLKAGKYSGGMKDDVVSRLKEMGIADESFAEGVLRESDRRKIAWTAADITEFGKGGWNKPLLMEATPELRTATQFLGWGASAWQLEVRHLTRAWRTGNWTPFIVGTAMSGVTGMLYQEAADIMAGRRPMMLEAGDKVRDMKNDWLRLSAGDITPADFTKKWGGEASYRFAMGLMSMSRASALAMIARGGFGGQVNVEDMQARIPKGPVLSDPFQVAKLVDDDAENDYLAKRKLSAWYSLYSDAKHIPGVNVAWAAAAGLLGGDDRLRSMKYNPRGKESWRTLFHLDENPWERGSDREFESQSTQAPVARPSGPRAPSKPWR